MGVKNDSFISLKALSIDELIKNIPKINIETDIKTALENSSKMKISKMQSDIKSVDEDISFGNILPDISLSASYSLSDSEFKESLKTSNSSWNIGLTMQWNIFDFNKKIDAYNIAKIENSREKITFQSESENYEAEIRKAYSEIKRLEKIKEVKLLELNSAVENYKIERELFNRNLLSTNDLLKSENSLRESEIELISTKLDYILAVENYKKILK